MNRCLGDVKMELKDVVDFVDDFVGKGIFE